MGDGLGEDLIDRVGHKAQVRTQGDLMHMPKRVIFGQRFFIEDIQGCHARPAGLEGGNKITFVNQT